MSDDDHASSGGPRVPASRATPAPAHLRLRSVARRSRRRAVCGRHRAVPQRAARSGSREPWSRSGAAWATSSAACISTRRSAWIAILASWRPRGSCRDSGDAPGSRSTCSSFRGRSFPASTTRSSWSTGSTTSNRQRLRQAVHRYFAEHLRRGGCLVLDTVQDPAYTYNHEVESLAPSGALIDRLGRYARNRDVWAVRRP